MSEPLDYRVIADIMSECGCEIAHTSARAILVYAVAKFVRRLFKKQGVNISKEESIEYALNPATQEYVAELMTSLVYNNEKERENEMKQKRTVTISDFAKKTGRSVESILDEVRREHASIKDWAVLAGVDLESVMNSDIGNSMAPSESHDNNCVSALADMFESENDEHMNHSETHSDADVQYEQDTALIASKEISSSEEQKESDSCNLSTDLITTYHGFVVNPADKNARIKTIITPEDFKIESDEITTPNEEIKLKHSFDENALHESNEHESATVKEDGLK